MIEERIFKKVVEAMSEPHRRYHTMRHIGEMFMVCELVGEYLSLIEMHAICLHDVVHRIPADPNVSNEEASALVAIELLKDDYPSGHVDQVAQVIRDTEKEIPTTPDSVLVINLDLVGLALNYWENKDLVYEEFKVAQGGGFDLQKFNRGRLAWLRNMLERDSIFVGGSFREFEERAVSNIKEEIQMLKEAGCE